MRLGPLEGDSLVGHINNEELQYRKFYEISKLGNHDDINPIFSVKVVKRIKEELSSKMKLKDEFVGRMAGPLV